jgi:hypothetical protein
MALLLENQDIPESGRLELDIRVSADIRVPAPEAQRRVTRLLAQDVSYQMYGGPPQLVVGGERVVWRVPAYLGLPKLGEFGPLGTVDVDVQTGAIEPLTPALTADLMAHARALTARYAAAPTAAG